MASCAIDEEKEMGQRHGHVISDNSSDRSWHLLGKRLPKSEIVFFSQVILIYIVVVTAIVNLSVYKDNNRLWISLLSGALGYLLPNPRLKYHHA